MDFCGFCLSPYNKGVSLSIKDPVTLKYSTTQKAIIEQHNDVTHEEKHKAKNATKAKTLTVSDMHLANVTRNLKHVE